MRLPFAKQDILQAGVELNANETDHNLGCNRPNWGLRRHSKDD